MEDSQIDFLRKASFGRFLPIPPPLAPPTPLQNVHPPTSIFLKETKGNCRSINFQFAEADLGCVFFPKLVLCTKTEY